MNRTRAIACSAAILLASAAQGAETIRASAIRTDGGARTSFFTVTLDRYSTDEERAQWREAFATGGQDALVDAWQKSKVTVGSCKFPNTLAYDIRAAVSVPTEKGRRIFMATDRPISGHEIVRGLRTQDYPIGWIEVEVGPDGKGEGRLIGAVKFKVKDDQLEMETWGTQPARLVNVVVAEKE